jgi:hypothetical protein
LVDGVRGRAWGLVARSIQKEFSDQICPQI